MFVQRSNPVLMADGSRKPIEEVKLGDMDACLVAIAEPHDLTTMATLNHRDFAVVRPVH